MKASKEYRAWMKRLIRGCAKRNGVVPGCLLDSPWMERKIQSGKRDNKAFKL